MNERIQELVEQAVTEVDVVYGDNPLNEELTKMYIPDCFAEKFAELIKQAIYDKVKEELIEDEAIDSEPAHFRQYLKGCNSGIVDALCIIKNFGVEE